MSVGGKVGDFTHLELEGLFTSGSVRNQSFPESVTTSEVYTELKQLSPYSKTKDREFMNGYTVYLS